ncbi:hypothetical protein KIPB_009345 [Kipferlia bialata]|uniref:Uncharacterized protein n=1 Tax=Kipferlia bialata TaxID=797122 RepID=A0A391NNU1_9EUKA|nr:hypothetical protein KIPB_009345 [Kipferlia bialata]|eukprot:g9345.t1
MSSKFLGRAVALYGKDSHRDPIRHAQALINYTAALSQSGEHRSAATQARKAVEILETCVEGGDRDDVILRYTLSCALYNRAAELEHCGRLIDAMDCYRQAAAVPVSEGDAVTDASSEDGMLRLCVDQALQAAEDIEVVLVQRSSLSRPVGFGDLERQGASRLRTGTKRSRKKTYHTPASRCTPASSSQVQPADAYPASRVKDVDGVSGGIMDVEGVCLMLTSTQAQAHKPQSGSGVPVQGASSRHDSGDNVSSTIGRGRPRPKIKNRNRPSPATTIPNFEGRLASNPMLSEIVGSMNRRHSEC